MAFSLNSISTVGIYEMRTLLRSWFFRIFAGLSVIGIGIFNIAANLTNSGAPFIYRALPASLPYVNLLVLNVGQAIVAVFLASEFLKQDRKNDTVEVIYARSMTNAEYILGKTLGILLVFFILNVLILSIGIGFSFLSNDSAKGILEYLYYPLLISVPTLVYVLGLSFFLMIVTKNQAITFIILLGYIAASIFYLDTRFYQIFDFIAYQIPMMKSSVGGFADLETTIIHRGIYFFIGLSLIFFTITRLDRLPQSKSFKFLPGLISIIFLLVGALLIYTYLNNKLEVINEKKQMIGLNNQYHSYSVITIDSCNLSLIHSNKNISVKAIISSKNNNEASIDTLIFSLNPGLKVESINIDNTDVNYVRDKQILKIIPDSKVLPGQTNSIQINYSGTINENTCFLDQNLDDFTDYFSFEIFKFKKRYAWLEQDFVLLTNEALWYPISGVSFSNENPSAYSPDFTVYKLDVSTKPSLMAISQGKAETDSTGNFSFSPEHPLPKISLLIGDYEKKSIDVDSVEYGIYTIKGNDYYSEYFTDIYDSLPGVIRDLKNEYEAEIGFTYPFNRFALAEVPVQFLLDKHLWTITSDAVQPEITFYTEKGLMMEETDLKKRKRRTERSMRREKEEITPTELQSRILKRFTRGNFMANHTEWYMFDRMDRNTMSFFPNYVTFKTNLSSSKWPAVNLSLQAYLKDRYSNPVSNYRWFSQDLSKEEKINLELKDDPLSDYDKFWKTDENDEDEIALYDLILAKGDYLFSIFRARYGEEEFNDFIDEFIENNSWHSFTLESLDSAMRLQFGESVLNEINNWYYGKSLPGFMIAGLETYKVHEEERTKYQVKFKIANPESTDGVVTINIFLDNPNEQNDRNAEPDFTKKLYIPAKSAKDVGFVFSTEPARMNIYTHISQNLPNTLIYDFGSFDQLRKTKAIEGIKDCALFDKTLPDGEIVIDNEDSTFKFTFENKVSYLKRLVNKNMDPGYEYSGIRFWNPPTNWNQVLRSGFYGKYIRSAAYTKSGLDDKVATWDAPVAEKGYYDVYFHTEKININWSRSRRQTKKSDYNFTVYYEGGKDELNFTDADVENGWNYMGTWFITPETAKVELSNKSVGPMVFADAVKWIKN